MSPRRNYSWKDRIPASFRSLDPYLAYREVKGLTPEEIVAGARKKSSLLHDCLEWDDTKAAHEFRLEEARHLSRSIVVEVMVIGDDGKDREPIIVRALEFVDTGDGQKRNIPIRQALGNANLKEQVLAHVRGDLLACKRKLRDYSFLSKAFGEAGPHIDRAIGALDG